MKEGSPQTIYLKDYKKPDYLIKTIDLTFELELEKTVVTNEMVVTVNYETTKDWRPLQFDGEKMELNNLTIEGRELQSGQYQLKDDSLTVNALENYLSDGCKEFKVKIVNTINPKENKALEGLYQSGNIYCTQNEPEGFRRITYFIDRPDNMSTYTTKIIGD